MTYCRELPLIGTFSLTRKLAQSFYYIFTRWRYSHLRTNSLRQTIFYETIFCPLWCIWSGWRRHRRLLPHISLFFFFRLQPCSGFLLRICTKFNLHQMTEERGQIVGRGEFFHYFRSTDCLQFFPLLCTWHCAYICTWHWISFIFFAFFPFVTLLSTLHIFSFLSNSLHWTSFIFFAFSPFVTLLSALHIFSFLSNSLHFALCCSLLCTYRPFHAHTTFLTTLLLPSILWRLHQSCLFSPFSLLQSVYKKM